MSRPIDSTITDVLSGAELTPFHLIDINIGGILYRYTDFQVSIYVDSIPTSGTFDAWSWSFGGTHHSIDSIVDDVDVTLLNLNNLFTPIFIEESVQGSEVNIWSGLLDADGDVIGVYRIFTGEIDSWDLSEDELSFTVVSELYQWTQKTLKKHSSSCRWRKFKAVGTCNYTGEASWCDRSYARCEALANTDNFGGFRWLPELEDEEIWWGRKRLQRK